MQNCRALTDCCPRHEIGSPSATSLAHHGLCHEPARGQGRRPPPFPSSRQVSSSHFVLVHFRAPTRGWPVRTSRMGRTEERGGGGGGGGGGGVASLVVDPLLSPRITAPRIITLDSSRQLSLPQHLSLLQQLYSLLPQQHRQFQNLLGAQTPSPSCLTLLPLCSSPVL